MSLLAVQRLTGRGEIPIELDFMTIPEALKDAKDSDRIVVDARTMRMLFGFCEDWGPLSKEKCAAQYKRFVTAEFLDRCINCMEAVVQDEATKEQVQYFLDRLKGVMKEEL